MSVKTSIGRVVPHYKGDWEANVQYNRLDNVLRNGSSYIALKDVPIGQDPADSHTEYWTLVAAKGDTGDIQSTPASARSIDPGLRPVVEVTSSGPADAKILNFDFSIPKGDKGDVGVQSVQVSATKNKQDGSGELDANDNPWATADFDSQTQELVIDFGIPPGHDGAGSVSSVDGVTPTSGNVNLGAVRYNESQPLSVAYQTIARQNIGTIKIPNEKTVNYFLKYIGENPSTNEPEWITAPIEVFPAGSSGSFLQKTNSGTQWVPVAQVPAGGNTGAVLTKQTGTDYDLTWSTAISNAEIDSIIE